MSSEKKNKIILILAGIIMIISLCIGFTKKEFQNDTFYTIKVGQSILKHGIDFKDHFSYHNLPYCYPHWLYDVGIYKIYKAFSYKGIYISTMILYMILSLLIFLINLKNTKSSFISIVVSIAATILCGIYATARAQLVSYIFFVLEIYFIERLLSSSKKRYMLALMVICVLLANIHAAVWPMFFVLCLPYIAENLLAKIKWKKKESKYFLKKLTLNKDKGFKLLLITFVICLFLGLLTPIKDTPYTYAIRIMMGDTQEYIREHFSLKLIEQPIVIVYILIFMLIAIFTKVKIKLSDFLLICGLILMSFIAVRHISFLITIGIIPLVRIIENFFSIGQDEPFDLELPPVSLLVIMIVVILCSKYIYDNTCNKEYISTSSYPVYALDYLKKKYDMDNVILYNDYDFGSYLLFKNVKVFIDSRSDLYTKPFNNKTDIFDECMDIADDYGRTFTKYKITHVLTYQSTELAKILKVSSNYKKVYSDGTFIIFETNNYKEE